jgi:alcohol dehydrogenase
VRAVAIYEHGGPEVVRVVDDWPESPLTSGGLMVGVEACSLNRNDLMVRDGLPGVPTELPRVPGADVAGVVLAQHTDVTFDWVGKRVLVDPMIALPGGKLGALGENVDGGMRERLCVPATNVVEIPGEVSFEQAAALPMAYATAHRLLFTRGQVTAGEHVVVLGASGGLGTGAVQLAALAGAEVTAVASSADKLERLRELGAAHLVRARGSDYGKKVWEQTEKRGADVIVDTIGAETWSTTLRTIARGGRILVCGATTGYAVETDLRYLWVREATIIGSDGFKRPDLERLLALVQSGELVPVIDRVAGFGDVADAQRAMEAREVFGKVVVSPTL